MRTSFLITIILLGAGCAGFSFSNAGKTSGLSIMQGPSTASVIQVNVVSPASEKLTFSLVEGNSRINPSEVNETLLEGTPKSKITYLRFNDLTSKNYQLSVTDKSGGLVDSRSVSTLDLNKTKGTAALISCTDDVFKKDQAAMWNDVLATSPDIIFYIGDNTYADKLSDGKRTGPASREQLWQRYLDSRLRHAVYKSKKLIPIVSIWDDHDFGANDGNRDYLEKETALTVFRTYYPQKPIAGVFESGPATGSVLKAFGQKFIFADDRFYRAPNLTPPMAEKHSKITQKPYNPVTQVENETHFGPEGEKWIYSQLNEKTVAWLFSGDQFFGAYHPFESYEGNHPNSFKTFLSNLKNKPARVLFLSGDRHLNEVMQIDSKVLGYTTYEITSSGLHAFVFPEGWKDFPNPRQIIGASGTRNYSLLDFDLSGKGLKLKVRAYGPSKTLLYEQDLNFY